MLEISNCNKWKKNNNYWIYKIKENKSNRDHKLERDKTRVMRGIIQDNKNQTQNDNKINLHKAEEVLGLKIMKISLNS